MGLKLARNELIRHSGLSGPTQMWVRPLDKLFRPNSIPIISIGLDQAHIYTVERPGNILFDRNIG